MRTALNAASRWSADRGPALMVRYPGDQLSDIPLSANTVGFAPIPLKNSLAKKSTQH
jgi:hypothetical protein